MASIYSILSKTVKSVTGIKNFSLFRKKIHKNIGRILYHKKYNASDLIAVMQEMGMKAGSVVCIHSSMKEFYNFKGAATDIIDEILKCIGPDGTLIMPAFVSNDIRRQPDYIFNAKKDKTAAGYLAETFRKYPGVKRSINIQHSVCAIGKYADYLLKDHQNCEDCWDKNSPYYRMCELNALIFNLGLPRSYMGTFHHCVESILKNEHPYWHQFFTIRKKYRYYDDNGNVLEYSCLEGGLIRRTREKKTTRFFTEEDWQIRRLSNLEIKVFYSKHCLAKMIDLGRKGIAVYYEPNPKKFQF